MSEYIIEYFLNLKLAIYQPIKYKIYPNQIFYYGNYNQSKQFDLKVNNIISPKVFKYSFV